VLVSIETFGVVDWKLASSCSLSPLNGLLGTTTQVVVLTHLPDVGLVCILWSCSAALLPSSQLSPTLL